MPGIGVGIGMLGRQGALRPFGVEILRNPEFLTADYWLAQLGWTVGSGEAVFSGASAALLAQITQPTFIPGAIYRTEFELTVITAGSCSLRFTGGTLVPGTSRTAPGIYVENLTALAGNTTFNLRSSASASFRVGRVSLQRIG